MAEYADATRAHRNDWGRGGAGRDAASASAAPRYFRAERLPATMITSSAKPITAHQATLSVSFCHFRTSHMAANPNEAVGESHRVRGFVLNR
jgi:hypothetical protein